MVFQFRTSGLVFVFMASVLLSFHQLWFFNNYNLETNFYILFNFFFFSFFNFYIFSPQTERSNRSIVTRIPGACKITPGILICKQFYGWKIKNKIWNQFATYISSTNRLANCLWSPNFMQKKSEKTTTSSPGHLTFLMLVTCYCPSKTVRRTFF